MDGVGIESSPPRRKRRGPEPLADDQLRLVVVATRFSLPEATRLDRLRGKRSRAEWLRLAGLQRPADPPAPMVPEINQVVWSDLALGPMSNLNQLLKFLHQLELKSPGAGVAELSLRVVELIELCHQIRDGLVQVRP